MMAFARIVDRDRVTCFERVMIDRHAGVIDDDDLIFVGKRHLLILMRRIGDDEVAVGIRMEAAVEMIGE